MKNLNSLKTINIVSQPDVRLCGFSFEITCYVKFLSNVLIVLLII